MLSYAIVPVFDEHKALSFILDLDVPALFVGVCFSKFNKEQAAEFKHLFKDLAASKSKSCWAKDQAHARSTISRNIRLLGLAAGVF